MFTHMLEVKKSTELYDGKKQMHKKNEGMQKWEKDRDEQRQCGGKDMRPRITENTGCK